MQSAQGDGLTRRFFEALFVNPNQGGKGKKKIILCKVSQ